MHSARNDRARAQQRVKELMRAKQSAAKLREEAEAEAVKNAKLRMMRGAKSY